jgi:hypothetical protein
MILVKWVVFMLRRETAGRDSMSRGWVSGGRVSR